MSITTLDEKHVVGRKEHTCGLCVRFIAKGEKHLAQTNVDGGDIWTWRAHLKCEAALPAYLDSIGIKPHWIEDYNTIDDTEFRAFVDNASDAEVNQ